MYLRLARWFLERCRNGARSLGLDRRSPVLSERRFFTQCVHDETGLINYKLAGPLAAIGLRRLRQLQTQLDTRRANAHRVLTVLPEGGLLAELGYTAADTPNYYNLVLTTPADVAESTAASLAGAGLPPDSVRYGYRPLYHRPIFTAYATACPNAEAMCAATFQLPVHPGMPDATLNWVASRIQAIAEGQRP